VVEDGGAQQKDPDLVGLTRQDFVGEVVDNEAVAPLERLDEVGYFSALPDAAEGERSELEPGDPALGALIERCTSAG
jgi:hypothetical protein